MGYFSTPNNPVPHSRHSRTKSLAHTSSFQVRHITQNELTTCISKAIPGYETSRAPGTASRFRRVRRGGRAGHPPARSPAPAGIAPRAAEAPGRCLPDPGPRWNRPRVPVPGPTRSGPTRSGAAHDVGPRDHDHRFRVTTRDPVSPDRRLTGASVPAAGPSGAAPSAHASLGASPSGRPALPRFARPGSGAPGVPDGSAGRADRAVRPAGCQHVEVPEAASPSTACACSLGHLPAPGTASAARNWSRASATRPAAR